MSEITNKKFPLRLILSVCELSSAAWYKKPDTKIPLQKRGPKPKTDDSTILNAIKNEIKESRFHSEGYKKICARINYKGIIVDKNRVYEIMKKNNLLTSQRPKRNGSSRKHDGTIKTNEPNKMWGTDGKQFYTQQEGRCWMFSVIDHFNDEILGHFICKKGDRFAALEPIKKAVKMRFGNLTKDICKNIDLTLRADHGTQYDSNDFQKEIKFLGFKYSPAFVRSPECNGIIERFHRTLQEQIFDINQFENLEEANIVISEFIDKYNDEWILHRLGLKSPKDYREEYEKKSKIIQKSA